VLENADVERHQQADRDRGQFQAGDHLRHVDGQQGVNRLERGENGVFDDDVEAIPAVQLLALVGNRQGALPFE
jgi:hypothetical protein